MTRPARDAAERAWLDERGGSPFVEDEACAEAARAYYARRYGADDGTLAARLATVYHAQRGRR